MSCLIDTKIPGGKVNYLMIRLSPEHELPQFRELAPKKWEQMYLGTEDKLYLKQQMILFRPLMTNLKMTEMTVLLLQVIPRPPTLSLKAFNLC